jgi:hypothetical protein
MPIDADARAVHKKVRDFFKGELKSNNKDYDTTKNTTAQATTRNNNRSTVLGLLSNDRTSKSQAANKVNVSTGINNYYAWGESISQEPKNSRIGNCYEMALLAGYYAAKDSGYAKRTWLGSISKLGDHAFCLIGPAVAPTWISAWKMEQAGDTTSWVIDPWANTCCTAADYATQFRDRMVRWGQAGKRVYFNGVPVDPSGSNYEIGFKLGEMKFTATS